MGQFQRESSSGMARLFRLTEALCELSCMHESAGRLTFAGVLGDQLGVPCDVRGVRMREDVVTLVRAALNVPGGERVLLDVVRIFEGPAAADGLERLFAPWAVPKGLAPELPGPLSPRETSTALVLLADVADWLPGTELRDRLAEELRIDLPSGLTPVQLFTHVMELNAQPDGLPPAVLLMDLAAGSVRIPGRRAALSAWVQDWAGQAGLLAQLEERRAARVRARTATDPSVPRCLVVVVEPTHDGSGEVVVRPWLNTVPGRWDPLPDEPVTTTLDDLGTALDRVLRQLARLAHQPDAPATTGSEAPAYVEFVLPYDLLNHDLAGLTARSGEGGPLPLGLRYGVHLRSLERMRADDARVRARWQERWRALREHGITVHDWRDTDGQRPDAWQSALATEPTYTAAVLETPPVGGAATEALKAAIAQGIGLALWDRRGALLEERREVVTAVLAAVPTADRLPFAIHRLRRTAELQRSGPHLLGRHIAFFWDDPTRLVDIEQDHPVIGTDVDTDIDTDVIGTIDNEESGT
ncbi:VMAP-C domain-containing protein [Streptomyces sp. NPDC002623]